MPKGIYKRSKQHKKALSKAKLGYRNPNWRGNNAGLDAIHIWILARKPKPKSCESCHKNKPKDLANISQTYLRDITDFEWLCRKCHMLKDGRMTKLIKFNESRKVLKEIGCLQCENKFIPVNSKVLHCSLSCAAKTLNLKRWHKTKINFVMKTKGYSFSEAVKCLQ